MNAKQRRDVYQEVTDRVISEVETTGVLPWERPWHTASGMPCNIRTGRPYRGINILLLALQPYADPRWGTYKAIGEAGGNVRKGEHGTHIVFWKKVHKVEDAEHEERNYLVMRDYVVFNAQQADGIEPLPITDANYVEPNEAAERVMEGYVNVPGPPVMYGYADAAYDPAKDIVYLPDQEAFESAEAFYSTVLHELTHSTGHEKRLNRGLTADFGSDPYAKEELVAELGAAMICGTVGIDNVAGRNGNASYVANWLERLRGDRKLIVSAAAAAQKAADIIVGATLDEETDEETAAEPVAV